MDIKNVSIHLLHGVILIISLSLSFLLGGIYVFIISFAFLLIAGIAEEIFMNRFYHKKIKNNFNKKKLIGKIKYGFLWTHSIIYYIKKYSTKIYDFKKIGYLPSITAYIIIGLYIIIPSFLHLMINYYSVLIYLIPVITNSYHFLKNNYYILEN